MSKIFPQFDVDYISGVMTLRKPQKTSLKRLDDILEAVTPSKNLNLDDALSKVNNLFPTCSNFEREFMSLTFALATGVGKTRLMGAFITYLYCQYGYRNFFVVAPNLTIYNKLKNDLGNPAHPKYVFKGCGCFSSPPRIYADDEYRQKRLDFDNSDINLYVFNIDKFNSDGAKMRSLNEYLGESFFDTLANLDDLVLLMDESHHYRAKNGANALNELRPILGLELTATPIVNSGSKQIKFKNVVYEYPLSMAIKDGYTRTPYAVARANIDSYNFSDEQLDKMMLLDGIHCHEKAKVHLEVYAKNNNKKVVKPFMLVVCKDTDHATWVLNYIRSNDFKNGKYHNKVITIHSNLRGSEKDDNIKLLLDVENPENPVEIVIHVNILKEGWDVNNLYTIVPLRTAASKILREQTIGRGLRLPYGERVGDKEVDAVMLTAHDKFAEIIEEAQSGGSIFKAGNVIIVEENETPEEIISTQPNLPLENDNTLEQAYNVTGLAQSEDNDRIIKDIDDKTYNKVVNAIGNGNVTPAKIIKIAQEVEEETKQDLGDRYNTNENPFSDWIAQHVEHVHNSITAHYIPIPQIKVTDYGVEEYIFNDFDLDLTELNHVPIANDILIQNLAKPEERERITGEVINFEGYAPLRALSELLREKPEIDYERCPKLFAKLITAAYEHYVSTFGEQGAMNIVMMYKVDIVNKIYNQMMRNFACTNSLIQEEVISVDATNKEQNFSYVVKLGLWDSFNNDLKITSICFEGIKKGVFRQAKFDSKPELLFAKILEQEIDVKNWLRPAHTQFNITYSRGKKYIPDFVVETKDTIYLVEIKGEDRLDNVDVIAKKQRAEQYCNVASNWSKANGYKSWKYLFIPANEVKTGSTFDTLATRFC